MSTRKGQCQCGAVSFEFDVEPTDASFCHCSLCRRMSGSAFTAWCEVPADALRLSDGGERLAHYAITDRLTKHFCRACGTQIYSEHSSYPGFAYVCLGALDEDAGIVPGYHQFVGSRARWYTIVDDLPQFDEWPPGEQ